MTYILPLQGLISTRVTDTGREKISQGNFNISYFQIGDSEIVYNFIEPKFYNIFEPSFNSQNSTGVPNSNKQNIKYPFFVDGSAGNTYGIPIMDSIINSIFNTSKMRGFFNYNINDVVIDSNGWDVDENISWSALTNNDYMISSNQTLPMSSFTCNFITESEIFSGDCNPREYRKVEVGDFLTLFFDDSENKCCYCESATTTPTVFTSSTDCNFVESSCPIVPEPQCVVPIHSCYPMLTFRVVRIEGGKIYFDRDFPNFSQINNTSNVRLLFYPGNMNKVYDSYTPRLHWRTDVIDYDSICGKDEFDVKVWNMNIPWSESPAGILPQFKQPIDYTSATYLGTKEYLGYSSDSGQTDSSVVYYYNSFDEKITVTPKEQKSIAIIHYSNKTIDFFYGEKFAMENFDSTVNDTTGQARNFKLHLPWLMWHKDPTCCLGQTFFVDPPGFVGKNLFSVQYIKSTKNSDMNSPGIRYFILWDTNPNDDGYPNRIGKVFPDQKVIIIDDEEIIASMSYKSNRNWTLPSPKVSLITPNILSPNTTNVGLLTGNTEQLYVSYVLHNETLASFSLHCNYYSVIKGPDVNCSGLPSQDVAVRFGKEFSCLNQPIIDSGTTFNPQGYYADKFKIICQKVPVGERPNPSLWKIIDFTDTLSATTINDLITEDGLSNTTFVITKQKYDSAGYYYLHQYITLPKTTEPSPTLTFGDEYYFYGNIETDIEGTIYEMNYKVNLSQNEFTVSSNPTWSLDKDKYISEIGLLDSDKNLLVLSKLSPPVKRNNIQQFVIKLDF